MKNRIALEEHFSIFGMTYKNNVMHAPTFADVRRRLVDTESLRIEAMDTAGIELSVLSFNSPGIQAETDPEAAVQAAKRASDFLCETVVARHPDRYAGFAVAPLQAPEAAANEIERCVKQLSFKAAVVNGYSNIQNENTEDYTDEPKLEVFLFKLADLNVIAGGNAVEGRGYFIRPTIVRDISYNSPVVREEQFGPVLPVLKYTNLEDAIARANDTEYGLGGTVWSKNPEKGLEVAKTIDSGLVWVNQHMVIDPTLSVGGAKHSGLGRELGLEGLLEFVRQHTIHMAGGSAAPILLCRLGDNARH